MTRLRFNIDMLNNYCKNNSVNLNKNYNSNNLNNLNRDSEISGFCVNKECCELFNKSFINMIKYGAYCKKCAKINQQINMKKTNLIKYGVENSFQSKEIKEKIKQTNLEKYGVVNPSYSKEIIQKIKNKCLEKYGL